MAVLASACGDAAMDGPGGSSGAGGPGGASGAGGAGGIPGCEFTASGPGALMQTDLWVMTDEGEEFFGVPPADAMCESEDELGYRSEELGGFPVFSVTTIFCDWITVTQPSMRWIRQGETVQLRFRHAVLNTPIGAMANAAVAIRDEVMWQDSFLIPQGSNFLTIDWLAPKDFPPCTPLYFHVDNHGDNEYSIVNLDVL